MKIQVNMKNNAGILSFLIGVCLFVSCDLSSGNSNVASGNQTISQVALDSINMRLDKLQSTCDSLEEKSSYLDEQLQLSRDSVALLQEQVVDLEGPKSVWMYISIAASILALLSLMLLLLFPKWLYERKVCDVFHNYFDQSPRIMEIKGTINQLNQAVYKSKGNNYNVSGKSQIERKMDEIIETLSLQQREIISLRNAQNTNGTGNISIGGKNVSETQKRTGYAKSNSGPYFLDILDSNQEGCVFCIKFLNDRRGEFDLISLDKIKSRNDWQDVVECSGNCTIEEAINYKLIDYGICELYSDGKSWEVKRKLKINLTK